MNSISVVIPSYNDTEQLEFCLDALNRQTIRENLEIIISLDGETPLPSEISRKADLVVKGPHAGPAATRNRGWMASSGEYLLFTDSDCIPDDHWAEEMTRVLMNGADAVKGIYSHGGTGVMQRLAQVEFEERYQILSRLESIDMVDTYSAGFRRETLERTGGFDETFPFPDHEDVDLSYRMISEGYRLHFAPAASVSHTHRNGWRSYFAMKVSRGRWRFKVLRSFPGKAGSDCYTPKCLRVQILLCLIFIPVLLFSIFQPIVLAFWTGCFLLTSIPLALVAAKTDISLIPLIPVFAFWRASALFSGLLWGIFSSGKAEK